MPTLNLKHMPSRKDKIKFWKQVLADCEVSGLCRAEYCRKHQIAPSTLYTWQKKIAKEEATIYKKKVIKEQSSETIDFVPVTLSSADTSFHSKAINNLIEIVLPSGISLKANQDIDVSYLTKLINALG